VSLFEKGELANGTSSQSTKLIHGGLRYLERPSQIPLVYECLHERSLLLNLVPDLVKPIELLIPVHQKKLVELLKIKIGLSMYDFLAGRSLIAKHKVLSFEEAYERVPLLKNKKDHHFYSYWDAQTDDKELVKRVAESARNLGGKVHEFSEVFSIKDQKNHWELKIRDSKGREAHVEASYVINCLGPWANDFLKNNNFSVPYKAENNKGVHLLFEDLGLQSGLLLKAVDQRIFFVLPWNGKTLVGTTENFFDGNQNHVTTSLAEKEYLLDSLYQSLGISFAEKKILRSFAGLRWLVVEEGRSLSRTSRESAWGTQKNQNGFVLTLYGGKLTSYRKLCEKIGNLVSKSAGVSAPTKTHLREFWKAPA
jgi:glycerol-3-phosphate dehydrogenase